MKELTEKQENYKEIIFKDLRENQELYKSRIGHKIFDRKPEQHIRIMTIIENTDKALNFEWDTENFTELVQINTHNLVDPSRSVDYLEKHNSAKLI